jgi:hypothetical protein
MAAEGAVAVTAAVLAGSVALLGLGLDSVIEALASIIVVWPFTGTRTPSQSAVRRARKAVAVTYFLLAAYVAAGAVRGGTPRGPGHGQSSDACLMASSTMCATCSSVSEYSISRACRLAVTMREVRSTRRCWETSGWLTPSAATSSCTALPWAASSRTIPSRTGEASARSSSLAASSEGSGRPGVVMCAS